METSRKRLRKEKGLSDLMAVRYDKLVSGYQFLFDRSVENTTAILRPEDLVLDIGCGTGIIALGIAGRVAAVTGVDLSSKMIAAAREKAASRGIRNVDFSVADGYSLHFAKQSYDVVILANILPIVEEPGTLLAEARRLLKPGGYLITLTDCYSEAVSSRQIRAQLLGYRFMGAVGFTYLNMYRKADVMGLLEENGFLIVKDEIVNQAPVCLYALAKKIRD